MTLSFWGEFISTCYIYKKNVKFLAVKSFEKNNFSFKNWLEWEFEWVFECSNEESNKSSPISLSFILSKENKLVSSMHNKK